MRIEGERESDNVEDRRAPGDFAQAYVVAHQVGHHEHLQDPVAVLEAGEPKGGQP